ncbi:MAG TPA: cadmium resistance transporter [Chryseolinea sp.]
MQIIVASIFAFVTTNIDDIFILVLLFSDPKFKKRCIVLGQYLGIATLTGLSFVGSFVGLLIDVKYVGLLGIVPIYIGIKSLVALVRNISEEKEDVTIALNPLKTGSIFQILSVASITIANGGDNISIYVPLYATLTSTGKIAMTVIFLLMTGLWCLLARYISSHPFASKRIEKYGHLVTPFVFILLGIYIMYQSNTLDLLVTK